MCGHTVIAKEAHRFLCLDRNKGSNEEIDDGCDEDKEQEDLGLQGSQSTPGIKVKTDLTICLGPTKHHTPAGTCKN